MVVDVDHNVCNAIKQVARGGMIILIDDEDRENEGDLVFAASDVCPEKINFMAKEARGLICLSLDKASTDRLQLPLMEGYTENWTNETVSQFGKTNLMIKKDHLKYQDYGVNGQEVLFDLHRDPSENQNFIDDPDYMESVNWFRQRLSQLGHGPNADPDYVNAGYARDV